MHGAENIRFFSPEADTLVLKNRLPHWDQDGRVYSITFRLTDSVPGHLLRQHRLAEVEWRKSHPEPWSAEVESDYLKMFRGQIEKWLDQGHGECLLKQPACTAVVAGALAHFEEQRTRLHAWVVMPNHVHALVEILPGHYLPEVMESWKGFTAREINKLLSRSGAVWQKGYYDRLIRDWTHFGNVVRYIRRNPCKSRLSEGMFRSGESPLGALF